MNELEKIASTGNVIRSYSSVENALANCLSDNTKKAYKKAWDRFQRSGHGLHSTQEDVAYYLAGLSLSISGIDIARAAIAKGYELSGFEDANNPAKSRLVRNTIRGLARQKSRRQRQAAPLSTGIVKDTIGIVESKMNLRDAVLVGLGFLGALRRSELAALQWQDIIFGNDGEVDIYIERSKTDKEGKGALVPIPSSLKPILEKWKAVSGGSGYILRRVYKNGKISEDGLSPQAVNLIIKKITKAAGLDSKLYSGHSLRAGFITEAAKAGAKLHKIQEVSRHSGIGMLLRYVRDASRHTDMAGDSLAF
jgi:integrase